MKKLNIRKIGLAILFLFTFTACDKWIDPDINIDPDSPTYAPLKTLLASAEARMAYVIGGMDITGTTSMWMQYVNGNSRQASIIGSYTIYEADVNNVWSSLYSGCLMDLNILINQAEDQDAYSPHMAGVGKVLTAYILGLMTDLWNAIPYSEAFQGSDLLAPKYDDQATIYQTINKLLDEAITDLQATESVYAIENDYIYGGDNDAWVKAAYALKARFAIHWSEVDGASAYDKALQALANGFTSNADDMQFVYGTASSEANPLYQFDLERGDVGENPAFMGTGVDTLDPRRAVFKDNGTWGSFFSSINSPTLFITYVEQKFIEAEAYLKGSTPDVAKAKQALKDAVAASLDKTGTTDATWLAQFNAVVDGVTDNNQLYQLIMYEKYLAMFCQPEAFADWRRTFTGTDYASAVPALQPVSGTKIPRCLPYPTSERNYNSNTPVRDIYTPVDWDK